VKLEWSPLAIMDREEIFDFVAADNPAAAVRLDERIAERVGRLMQFPEMSPDPRDQLVRAGDVSTP
jgi:plasmid stabilization system protein ParE